MNASAYRSSEAVVKERIDVIRAARNEEPYREAFEAARKVAVSRIARACAGALAALSGVGVLAFAVGEYVESPAPLDLFGVESTTANLAEVSLVGGWVAGLSGAVVAFVIAHEVLPVHANPPARSALDPASELALLERCDPLVEMRSLASRWEFAAAATPLVALSLLAPLTLHLVVALVCLGGFDAVRGFRTEWMPMSALIVGHAHFALAIASVLWAKSLPRREAIEVRLRVQRSWGKALVGTIVVSCLPGILFFGMPPILVALTGLAFVPWMFRSTAKTLVREREMLGAE